jgi:hypothetical protein
MRTYGRVTDPATGVRYWVEVDPDPAGFTDSVYLTALCQTLKLNLNESPFFGNWGIPAFPSVEQQIQPDFYVNLTQQRYAPFFMFLGVIKVPTNYPETPVYNITCRFQSGATDSITVIPQAQLDGSGQPITDAEGNPIIIGTKSGRFVAQ